jgi:hypothetical protein
MKDEGGENVEGKDLKKSKQNCHEAALYPKWMKDSHFRIMCQPPQRSNIIMVIQG